MSDPDTRLLLRAAILPYWKGHAWYEVHPATSPLPKFKQLSEVEEDG